MCPYILQVIYQIITRKKDVELFKNIQIKIILVLVIVGIIVISGIGFFSMSTMRQLEQNVIEKEAVEVQIQQSKILFISGMSIFDII